MLRLFGVARMLAIAVFCGYVATCLYACIWQRQVLYHPSRAIAAPGTYELDDYEDVRLTDQDGTQIDSWVRQANPGYPTLIFFHGNGGNLADHKRLLRHFGEAGFGVIAVDYRGYGASDGDPSERGLYQDARAAIHYASDVEHLKPAQIVLYGESLGTGVAIEAATQLPVGGLVLQSPYTSIEDLGRDRFPWLPLHYFLFDRFDSIEKIGRLHVPLLILHGKMDTTVPVRYGEQLFAQANEPKEIVYFPDSGHNDMPIPGRTDAVVAFATKYGLIRH